MSNILLAQITLEGDAPPLSILYIANALEKKGHKVKVCCCKPDEIHKIENITKTFKPLFLGISVYTSPMLKSVIKISKIIKHKYKIPIIWGGVHPSLFPKQCLEKDYVDIVALGEGEKTITEVANRLKQKKPLKNIKGICYKENSKIILTDQADFYKNLDEYEPSWHLINVEKYITEKWGKNRTLSIITSRGCPFECAFCWNIGFYKRLWRGHSAKQTIKQINFLKKQYNLNGIDFEDSYFFTDRKRMKEIIENINLDWGASIRATDLTDDLMKLLKKNRCKRLYIGAESGSQDVLNLMKKHIKVKDIINAARFCDKYKILGRFSFIVGVPGETKKNLHETLDLITKLKHNYKSIRIDGPKVFTPYPGAEFYYKAIKKGFQPPKDVEEWSNFTRDKCYLPWIKNKSALESLQYISRIAHSNPKNIIGKIAKAFEKFRWKNKIFIFPIETKIISYIYSNPKIFKLLSKIYGDKGRQLIQ